MKGRYIDLFTDFGFKRLFGEERSKPNLISFLNTLLPERHHIADLSFGNNEQQSNSVLDLNCVSSRGDHFIVELQQAKQNFFKDRSLFYATFPIQQQAVQGEWNFNLSAVYTIGILDFLFDEDKENPTEQDQVIHRPPPDPHADLSKLPSASPVGAASAANGVAAGRKPRCPRPSRPTPLPQSEASIEPQSHLVGAASAANSGGRPSPSLTTPHNEYGQSNP